MVDECPMDVRCEWCKVWKHWKQYLNVSLCVCSPSHGSSCLDNSECSIRLNSLKGEKCLWCLVVSRPWVDCYMISSLQTWQHQNLLSMFCEKSFFFVLFCFLKFYYYMSVFLFLVYFNISYIFSIHFYCIFGSGAAWYTTPSEVLPLSLHLKNMQQQQHTAHKIYSCDTNGCSCFAILSSVFSSSGMHQQSHPSRCEDGNFSWPLCLAWSKQVGAEGHSTYLNA